MNQSQDDEVTLGLGGIPITTTEAGLTSGTAFLLAQSCKESASVTLENGAEVEVKEGIHYVVARIPEQGSFERVKKEGYNAVQQGLDILSMRGTIHCSIREASEEHLVWWMEKDTAIFRAVTTSTFRPRVKSNATIRDADGNEVEPKPEIPTHHEAFRFFRLAQTTEDLFDAYRNMYLAFELLLSCKISKNREQERAWLQRAMHEVKHELGLESILGGEFGDPVEQFLEVVYCRARLPLFHAKDERYYFLPSDSASKSQVTTALALLTKVVIKMADSWHGVKFQNAALFPAVIYRGAEAILSGARMLVSDDSSPYDKSQQDLQHVRYRNCTWMKAEVSSSPSSSMGPSILGRIEVGNLPIPPKIWRVEIANDEHPMACLRLENSLSLIGVDIFECRFNIGVINQQQPKSVYSK